MLNFNLWETIQRIAEGLRIPVKQRVIILASLNNEIESSWNRYQNMPKVEKDKIKLELAHNLGCKSNDPEVCSKYIYNHAHGKL